MTDLEAMRGDLENLAEIVSTHLADQDPDLPVAQETVTAAEELAAMVTQYFREVDFQATMSDLMARWAR